MERRVSVLGALVLGFLVCPATARADCHDGKAFAELNAKGLSRTSCRAFVQEDYTNAWGNEQMAAEGLLMPDAEITFEESKPARYAGPEALRKLQADQAKFRGTYYTPVITGGSHFKFEPGDNHHDDPYAYAENLARVSWTGVARCKKAGCENETSERVTAILARKGEGKAARWRILAAYVTRTPIKPAPSPN